MMVKNAMKIFQNNNYCHKTTGYQQQIHIIIRILEIAYFSLALYFQHKYLLSV